MGPTVETRLETLISRRSAVMMQVTEEPLTPTETHLKTRSKVVIPEETRTHLHEMLTRQ